MKVSDAERLERGDMQIRAIIEVLGKPKSHVEESLRGYIAKLKTDKDFTVIEESVEEAVPQDDLFSSFAELTLWVKGPESVISFCFDYMPSSIEVLKPSKITFDAARFASYLNDLQARLHQLDLLVKTLTAQNQTLNGNAKNLLRNLILLSLRRGAQTIEELSRDVAIKEDDLEKLLNPLVRDKIIAREGDRYAIHG